MWGMILKWGGSYPFTDYVVIVIVIFSSLFVLLLLEFLLLLQLPLLLLWLLLFLQLALRSILKSSHLFSQNDSREFESLTKFKLKYYSEISPI